MRKQETKWRTCPNCRGSGLDFYSHVCEYCRGTGKVSIGEFRQSSNRGRWW